MRKLSILFFIFMFSCCSSLLKAQPGSLDTSFATNGRLLFRHNDGGCTNLGVQKDNKIVGANSFDFSMNRLTQEGSLDITFGTNGFIDPFPDKRHILYDFTIQPDGKILAAGGYQVSTFPVKYRGFAARFNSDGTADSLSAPSGYIQTYASLTELYYTTLVLRPDNNIVLAGKGTDSTGNYKIVVSCFNQDGISNNAFGNKGTVIITIPGASYFYPKILAQPDGKIILASGFTSTGIYKSVLLRLNSNGSLDSSFAYHGMNIFNFAPGQNFIFHSGGKLLLGGSNGTFGAFMQFTATGIIDSTFGNKGLAILDSVRYIRSFAIQWDGKIIGINPDLYTNWYELVRVTPDGLFDTTFGNHGIVRSYFDSIAVLQTAYSIAIQHGGKVIVGGISQENINPNIYYYYSLARFNTGLNCPSPVALFTYQSDTSAVQFTDHSSSATGWHWSFGDSTYSIEQNPVHTYPAIGKYFNCLNISDSCGSGQFCDSVKLIPNGIPASVQNTVKIFPNPVNDYLNLEFPATYSTISGIIQIRNIIGEKLLEMEINTQRIIIDTKKFTPGAYQLIILSDDKIICKRFIKL